MIFTFTWFDLQFLPKDDIFCVFAVSFQQYRFNIGMVFPFLTREPIQSLGGNNVNIICSSTGFDQNQHSTQKLLMIGIVAVCQKLTIKLLQQKVASVII